ncbi:MAG TPA: hypothetical protein VFE60_10865 [Roseiarcus sp.]|jgi:DNA repair ATPase RecN|nr:hypothetical protein [Roseiarcus sp.]
MNTHERHDFNFLFSGLHLDEQAREIIKDRLQSLDGFSEEVTKAVRAAEECLDAIQRKVEPAHLDMINEHLNGFADIERRITRDNTDSLNRVRKVQANIKTLMDGALRKQALEKCRAALVGLSTSQKQEVARVLTLDADDSLPF